MNRAKITICSYNGTFFLESLSNNVPTIIFIKDPFTEFRKNSHNDISNLLKAGILYDDLDKLIWFLNKNYERINIWWNTKKVQKAVNKFKRKYSRKSQSWLYDILHKISNKI